MSLGSAFRFFTSASGVGARWGLTKRSLTTAPPFQYQDLFQLDPSADPTPYRKLTSDYVSTFDVNGKQVTVVQPEALTLLASEAMRDIAHLLRPGHLKQLRKITDDPEASANDRFVAYELLKNACVSAGMVLPGCQDTGTAIVMGKKGELVWTDCPSDEEALSRGIHKTYTETSLRYSQLAPLTMFKERNTGTNLPAQIDLYSTKGNSYDLMFIAKGGGSANKTFLYQQTKAVLNPASMLSFLDEKVKSLGTSACPPYHLAVVIGGTSAEANLKTVKLASTKYLDTLPTEGNELGRAFRDLEMEEELHKLTQENGIGAQFGGKYFCHDVRVVRLPRHGASCPIGVGVSCSADRQVKAKINSEGVFIEQLETGLPLRFVDLEGSKEEDTNEKTDPAKYLPEVDPSSLGGEVVKIDLNKPMDEIRSTLSQYPVKTRLSLTGTIVVARDIAHAKLKKRLESGKGLPEYIKNSIIYYAGPAKTPKGYASGSFGPTTAGRMDPYVEEFQKNGGSLITLAKGNRSDVVRRACKAHGGFYLGSIGGQAANLAKDSIKKVEVLEYPELGMEAIWRVEVENFPAFIVIDDKGNDFFKMKNK